MKRRFLSVLLTICMLAGLMASFSFNVAAEEILEEGKHGENLEWSLDSDGILTINCYGEMENFESEGSPWYSYREIITVVNINKEIANIGDYAFEGCDMITEVNYDGSEVEWCGVLMGEGNECLINAVINFSGGSERIYTVNFYDYDGNLIESQLVPEGYPAVEPIAPEMPGYMFLSWDQDITYIMCDMDVYPIYEVIVEPIMYNVTFEDYDGTILSEQTVMEGDDATPPDVPEREGYIFMGWDGDFTNVTVDMVLTAQYEKEETPEPIYYTVVFKDYDGTILSEQVIEEGKSAQAPEVAGRENYTFKGWNVDFSNITSNLSVTAVYERTVIVKGEFNTNIKWVLYQDGELVVEGEGHMPDYDNADDTPWASYQDKILKVTVKIGITGIGDYAFAYCANLVEADLPEGLEDIGKYAFAFCFKLSIIELPDDISNIGDSAFESCKSIVKITIPENVNFLGARAFYDCQELESVVVVSITVVFGDNPFANCGCLVDIYFSGSKEQWTYIIEQSGNEFSVSVTINCSDGKIDYTGGGTGDGSDTEGGLGGGGGSSTEITKKVTVSSEMAASGETVTITVTADENIGMATGSMMLNYDREKLTLTDYAFGDVLTGTNNVINTEYVDNGETKIYASFLGLDNISAGGVLLTLTFEVNADVQDDTHIPVTVDRISFYDANENQITVNGVSGEVHVLNYELGDINNDGVISLIDVLRVMKYDVGMIDFTTAQKYAADVNGDEVINLQDALLIQKYDAGLIESF